MKRYYLMIVAGSTISLSSVFYKIAAGTSARDVKSLLFLQDFAAHHGHFLAIFSREVDVFLHRIAGSLGVSLLDLNFVSAQVSALVAHIRKFKRLPSAPPLAHAAAMSRQVLSPAAYFYAKNRVIHHAESVQRKKPKAISNGTYGFNTVPTFVQACVCFFFTFFLLSI